MQREKSKSIQKKKEELNSSQMAILKKARYNQGIYDKREAKTRINMSLNDDKMKIQMHKWNDYNLKRLTELGYLEKRDENIYIIRDEAKEKITKPFVPGKNHAKLLSKNEGGIIKVKDLKKESVEREKKFIDGMIKNLHKNGYLERIERGEYRLTDTAIKFIDGCDLSNIEKHNKKNPSEFKITRFDRHLLEVAKDGKIDQDLLNAHEKKDSIIKRINTLKKNGCIDENGNLSQNFIKTIEKNEALQKGKEFKFEMLTEMQKTVLKDIRVFLNLSDQQLLDNVYNKNKLLMEQELSVLLKNSCIKKDEDFGLYIMDTNGISITNALFRGRAKYSTKIYTRKEEVMHDNYLYDAYKSWEKEAIKKGYKIIDIKNDRELRKEYGQNNDLKGKSLPDLRVVYEHKGKTFTYDIEMDMGYDSRTISSKIAALAGSGSGVASTARNIGSTNVSANTSQSINNGLSNGSAAGNIGSTNASTNTSQRINSGPSNGSAAGLMWCCNTLTQAKRVEKIFQAKHNKRNIKMDIFYRKEDGSLEKI